MAVSSKPVPGKAPGIRRYLPRTWRGWLLSILGPIVLLLLIMYLMARMTPSWYQPLDPNSQMVIDAQDIGENKLKSGLHNTFQRVPLGDQLWSISQLEINSVLAARTAPPLNPDGTRSYPAGSKYPVVSAPFVLFTPGKVTVAARTTKLPGPAPGGGVGSVTFSVETVAASSASSPPRGLIKLEGAWAGNLRIPTSLVESKFRSLLPGMLAELSRTYSLGVGDPSKVMPKIEEMIHAVQEGESFEMKFPYDKRTVIVKEIRVDDGSLTVIFGPLVPAAVRPRPLP